MATDRNSLIADRIDDRMWAICKAVPPIEPPSTHWLNSDAGPSYCRECAVKARAEEFGLGEPLDRIWWRRTDLEDAFYGGIDGGFEASSEVPEACDTCGRTLSYILTEGGVRDEANCYLEHPLTELREEDSYALGRLTLNVWHGTKRRLLLDVAVIVNHAFRLTLKEPTS